VEKDIAKQLGKRVRELRANKKLTQEELAGESGISLKYIQRIEGKKPPNLGIVKVQELAKGFGIEPWQLLKF
jgi:transcriptional regulator with XRE-family HTH domain